MYNTKLWQYPATTVLGIAYQALNGYKIIS